MRRIWVAGGTGQIGDALMRRLSVFAELRCSDGVDVRSADQIQRFATRSGPFDALVYAVGINHLDWSRSISMERAADLYDVNVLGLLRCLQAESALKRVVVIGSDAAWRPMRTSVAYCASKAALHMAVEVVSRERPELAINVVAPGKVEGGAMTEYVDRRSAELRPDMDHIDYQRSQIPGGEFVSAKDVASVVASVLEAPTALRGAIIPVNGGR